MKFFKTALIIFTIGVIAFSCSKKKEMTIEDYMKIDMEIISTKMTPESIAEVAKKYGYTLEQYQQFADRVSKESALQEKLGELKLGDPKKGIKDIK